MSGRKEDDGEGAGSSAHGARSARSRPQAADSSIRTVEAQQLLGPGGVLRIDLDGELYTLRLTRNHRLILTK